ncbi:MAG: hypothetical protein DMG99_15245 [Acidobacteria bacterium]|nr:MAG: hypothetical protein DMG99_15245 [Acidobacteriota bacterium]
MRRVTSFVIIAVASLVFCQLSMGQAVYGNILGTVTDKSGAAVPNVDVKITDLDRGTTSQVKTNESGNYEQTHLLAGRYKVSVAASGFAAFEATAEVQIDSSTRVDIPLGVQDSGDRDRRDPAAEGGPRGREHHAHDRGTRQPSDFESECHADAAGNSRSATAQRLATLAG